MQRMGQKNSIQKILNIFQPNEKMEDVAFFLQKWKINQTLWRLGFPGQLQRALPFSFPLIIFVSVFLPVHLDTFKDQSEMRE